MCVCACVRVCGWVAGWLGDLYSFVLRFRQMGLTVNAAILGGIATIVTNMGGAQGIFRNKMEAMAGLVIVF